jgi:hypothetical protein
MTLVADQPGMRIVCDNLFELDPTGISSRIDLFFAQAIFLLWTCGTILEIHHRPNDSVLKPISCLSAPLSFLITFSYNNCSQPQQLQHQVVLFHRRQS